jgi:hypothetical protein
MRKNLQKATQSSKPAAENPIPAATAPPKEMVTETQEPGETANPGVAAEPGRPVQPDSVEQKPQPVFLAKPKQPAEDLPGDEFALTTALYARRLILIQQKIAEIKPELLTTYLDKHVFESNQASHKAYRTRLQYIITLKNNTDQALQNLDRKLIERLEKANPELDKQLPSLKDLDQKVEILKELSQMFKDFTDTIQKQGSQLLELEEKKFSLEQELASNIHESISNEVNQLKNDLRLANEKNNLLYSELASEKSKVAKLEQKLSISISEKEELLFRDFADLLSQQKFQTEFEAYFYEHLPLRTPFENQDKKEVPNKRKKAWEALREWLKEKTEDHQIEETN